MVYDKIIVGRYVQLRSIDAQDVDFSLEIRQDKEHTKYLHAVDNNKEKQLKWIETQRKREGDYFFIAETLDGKKVGTVGIYDIAEDTGHLGRLLMIGNPLQTFEATMLSVDFAYDVLGLKKLTGDVHKDNKASLNISEAFGIHFDDPVYDDELDRYVCYGTAYKEEYAAYRNKIVSLIYR